MLHSTRVCLGILILALFVCGCGKGTGALPVRSAAASASGFSAELAESSPVARSRFADVDATDLDIGAVHVESVWDAAAFPWSVRFQDPRVLGKALSPDGRRLLWRAQDPQAYWLYLSDADGGNLRRLQDCRDGYQPVWSPDSTRFVYCSVDWRGKVRGLFIDAPDSPAASRRCFFADIKPSTVPERFRTLGALADWSPDGKKIVYNYYGNLWLTNASGIGHSLLNLAGRIGRPVGDAGLIGWSADGTRLAWCMRGERTVYAMTLVRRP